MSLAGVAQETVHIAERGTYRAPSGATVELRADIDAAVRGTVLYRPADFAALTWAPSAAPTAPRIEVTPETTVLAGHRLVEVEHEPHVVALNFASARNPGGGFLRGARAQEEDLARCSALYGCQLAAPAYYAANRAESSLLYTDHIIYSPAVPFFRDARGVLLEKPFPLAIITAPAPNAGEVLRRDRHAGAEVQKTLEARVAHVLAVAASNGHRCLVLGAWGCGVFRNDPEHVAGAFARWLDDARFRGAFARVVFAVHTREKDQSNLRAFEARFVERAPGLSA